MKTKALFFAITMLMACAASQRVMSQTLTVYQKDGTTTEVACSGKFKQTIASEFLIITADGSNYTFFLSDVDSVAFSQTVGDVNRDGQVGIGDIVAITNIMAGTEADVGETKTYTVNGVSFTMVDVKGGTFQMGSNDGYDWEKPVHSVTLSSFSIGQTEVTQELWYAVMGQKPTADGDQWESTYGLGDQYPAYNVSWDDCQAFITKLNQLTGQTFRLPTEAEWEFAARGGNSSKGYQYAGSDDLGNVAWYWDNIPSQSYGTAGYGAQPVGTKQANELGLYDMSGNVWEWCQDWYGSYSSDAQTNPTGAASGSFRVFRGGSWSYGATYCRVAHRDSNAPSGRYGGTGFRLAL